MTRKILLVEIGYGFDILGTFPPVTLNTTYTVTVTAIGGVGIKTLSVASEDLPDAYTFTDNGDSTGTFEIDDPETAGTFSLRLRAIDQNGVPFEKTFSIVVVASELTIVFDFLDDGVVAEPANGHWTIIGGTPPYSVVISNFPLNVEAIATGIDVDLDGAPHISAVAGSPHAVSFTIQDAANSIATWNGSYVVTENLDEIRRELRSKCVIAHDFANSLAQGGRTGLALSGTAAYTTGPSGASNTALASSGSAVRFDQTDIRGLNCIHATQRFAIAIAARPTSTVRTGAPTYLFSVANGGNQLVSAYRPAGAAANPTSLDFLVGLSGSGQQILNSSSTVAQGSWGFWVLQCTGTGLQIYLDNALVAQAALTAGTIGTFLDWAIGEAGSGSLHTSLGFDVSNFAYFHDSLSEDAIEHLWNNGDGRPSSDWMTTPYGTTAEAHAIAVGVTAYYALNASSGTNATDSAGGLGTATLDNGAAYINTIDPPAGFPASDYVVDLVPNPDVVTAPGWNMSSGSKSFTLATWVNRDVNGTSDGYLFTGTNAAGTADGIILQADASTSTSVTARILNAGGSNLATYTVTNALVNTGQWYHACLWYDQTNDNYLTIIDGIVHGGVHDVDEPTAANRTFTRLGSGPSNGTDGKLSNAWLKYAGLISLPDIAKFVDLSNGSG